MAKVLSEEARQVQEESRRRVTLLLATFFAGRQRRMAEAMKVPQSQISRIVNGQLGVSVEFLDAMARLPGVNSDWVRRGVGEPMLPSTRGTLPVALGVLPGLPLEYPHLFTGQRHPVAEALEQTSRYWLELQVSSPLIRDPGLKLLPGDLLLMEAAPEWTSRMDLIVGRLCGARLETDRPEPSFVLGKMNRDSLGLVLDLIGSLITRSEKARLQDPTPESTPTPSSGPAEKPTSKPDNVPRRRTIRPLDKEVEKAKRRREFQQQTRDEPSPIFRINIESVVGVCVYMGRPSPGASST